MNRDNFDEYKNQSEYWLKEDALRSLDYDVYFSLGTRYYCDAGCKVCYIKDNLKQTKLLDVFPNDLEKYKEEWFNFFEYFGVVRTNDDLYYKMTHPGLLIPLIAEGVMNTLFPNNYSTNFNLINAVSNINHLITSISDAIIIDGIIIPKTVNLCNIQNIEIHSLPCNIPYQNNLNLQNYKIKL